MATTPSGNISSKPNGRHTFRRQLKIEKIARYTVQGYSDDEIALVMGITKVYVSMLRRTPEFLSICTSLTTGVISDLDALTKQDLETKQDDLRALLPDAMLALRDILYDKSNPRLRLEAAKQIMDREGTLAIVSKSEIKKKVEFDFSEHDKNTNDLLSIMQGAAPLSASSALDEFINSVEDPDGIEKVKQQLDLGQLEVRNKTVQ